MFTVSCLFSSFIFCNKYFYILHSVLTGESLLPKKKKVDIYFPIYLGAGGLGFLIILCCISVYIYRHYGHRDIDCTC